MAYSRRSQQSMAVRWGRNPGTVNQNLFNWLYGRNLLTQMWDGNADGSLKY